MGPLLKICGLMRREDVAMCCRKGVDICGFVTEYPMDVPWNLAREQCAALIRSVVPPAKSCIVTGGDRGKIISLALALRPDLVQLHYRETLEDTVAIMQALSPHGIGIIKTIPASPEECLRQFGVGNPESCAKQLCEAGVYAILVDGRGPSNAASAGAAAGISFFRCVQAASSRPVMLGGGITPENCRDTVDKVRPEIIDVMTGAEAAPGIKSAKKIAQLLHRL